MNAMLCRICGGTENLKHISDGGEDLVHKLFTCANILIKDDDELPNFICYSCEQGLEFSYNLRKRGEETEKKLRQRLAANAQDQRDQDECSNLSAMEELESKPFMELQNSPLESDDKAELCDILQIKHRAKRKASCDTSDEEDCQLPSADLSFETKFSHTFDYEQHTNSSIISNSEMENGFASDENLEDADDEQDTKPAVKLENIMANKSDEPKAEIKYNVLAEVVISDDEDDDVEQFDVKQEATQDESTSTQFKTEPLIDFGDEDSVDYYFLDDSDYNDEQTFDDQEECDINEYQHNQESLDRTSEAEYFSDNIDYLISDQTVETSSCSIERVEEHGIENIYLNNANVAETMNRQQKRMCCYKCETCHEEFDKQSTYREHIKQHGNKRFQCIQCGRWFPTRYRLESHERFHSDTGDMIDCPHCNRTYRSRSNLLRHLRTVHNVLPNYICELCGMNFNRIDVLKLHKLRHTDEYVFECRLCEAKFKCKRYLNSHMKRHSKRMAEGRDMRADNALVSKSTLPKTYICPHCGKISTHSAVHKNHLRIHTKEMPFSCDVCQKGFRTMAAVITHERLHTDNRPYQCEYCLISFRQSSHLKEHKRTHTGELPYTCGVCKQAFRKKSNLLVHMRIHGNEKLYKCALCSETFDRMHLLKQHEQNVHDAASVWDGCDAFIEQSKHEIVNNAEKAYAMDRVTPADEMNSMFTDCKNDIENNDTNNKHKLSAYLNSEFKNSATMTVIPCNAGNDDTAAVVGDSNDFDHFYTIADEL